MKKYLDNVQEVVEALKKGETVFTTVTSSEVFYMYEGVIVKACKNGHKYVGAMLPIKPDTFRYYIKVEDPLKLETGMSYRIKDSRKAFICWTDEDFAYGCIEHWSKLCKWNREGGRADGPGNTDIIEEWS